MKNLATIQTDDGWDDAAAENAERVIKGTLLKYSDWKWTKSKENIEVKEGICLVALATAAGWVKWHDGKPSGEPLMRQPGKRLPERDELGDLDKTKWELGPDGQPKDPWQNTRFVYLVDPISAEAYTFVTASWGGRQAVNDLAEQIQRVRYRNPGASPLVELHAEPWMTKFGRKSKPFFKVVGWRGGEQQAIDRHDGGPRNGGPPPALVEASSIPSRSIDDEIPF